AIVRVDGVPAGRAPGVVDVAPGQHTITIRAERYVDYIATVNMEGAGVRQDLKAQLQPSWGTLKIASVPVGAHITADGSDSATVPANVAAPAGVRHVQLSAPGLKIWESSVVLKAGETLNVGPVTLGQADAHLTVRSTPPGAEVTIA